MSLSPEILREAADRLSADNHSPDERHMFEYMCHAVEDVVGIDDCSEFSSLLADHHVSCSGDLAHYVNDRIVPYYFSMEEYFSSAQSIRFMFLEFLALDMESQS